MPKAIFGLPNHQECPCGDYVSEPITGPQAFGAATKDAIIHSPSVSWSLLFKKVKSAS